MLRLVPGDRECPPRADPACHTLRFLFGCSSCFPKTTGGFTGQDGSVLSCQARTCSHCIPAKAGATCILCSSKHRWPVTLALKQVPPTGFGGLGSSMKPALLLPCIAAHPWSPRQQIGNHRNRGARLRAPALCCLPLSGMLQSRPRRSLLRPPHASQFHYPRVATSYCDFLGEEMASLGAWI